MLKFMRNCMAKNWQNKTSSALLTLYLDGNIEGTPSILWMECLWGIGN